MKRHLKDVDKSVKNYKNIEQREEENGKTTIG